jgi:hypothetical protein
MCECRLCVRCAVSNSPRKGRLACAECGQGHRGRGEHTTYMCPVDQRSSCICCPAKCPSTARPSQVLHPHAQLPNRAPQHHRRRRNGLACLFCCSLLLVALLSFHVCSTVHGAGQLSEVQYDTIQKVQYGAAQSCKTATFLSCKTSMRLQPGFTAFHCLNVASATPIHTSNIRLVTESKWPLTQHRSHPAPPKVKPS